MSNKGYLAIIGILVIVVGGLGYKFYSFKKNAEQEIQNLDVEYQASEIERERLELDLEKMIIGYDTLKTENEQMLLAMAEQRVEIEGLLKKVKSGRYEISSLKQEGETLRRIMKSYVAQIDSLNTINQNLTAQVGDLEQGIAERDMQIEGLEDKTNNLETMVSSGQTLQSSGMSAQGIRLTNSGNQREASRASRADLIKTCFTIIKNPIAKPGQKTLYMTIKGPDGQVLAAEGGAKTVELEGEMSAYSVERNIDYRNETMDVCIYYTVSGELSKGDYAIEVFEDGKKIGTTDLSLK